MAQHTPNASYSDFLKILRRSTDLLNDDPIKEEIFSAEKLEHYAKFLATDLKIIKQRTKGKNLLPQIRKKGKGLLKAYLSITEAIQKKDTLSPAAEWFVDNFHIVDDQLRDIREGLPNNYYEELPKLAHGELAGLPRVYAIALAIISHTDCRLDSDMLRRFLQAFQSIEPLQIGELWAMSITLRIALVEQLEPLTQRIVSARINRERADQLADQLIEQAALPSVQPQELIDTLSQQLGHVKNFDRANVVHLIQRIRDHDPNLWPAFDWLEKQLHEHHQTTTQKVSDLEHFRQAAAQVTVGNIIASMRMLSSMDWRDFFESVSLVDPILARDPSSVYSKMDFSTRDRYRHAVERIARYSTYSELEVASKAIERTQRAASDIDPTDLFAEKNSHVGYYLIGYGLWDFERSLGYKPRFHEMVRRAIRRIAPIAFLSSVFLLTLSFIAPMLLYLHLSGGPLWSLFCFAIIAYIPASEMALSCLNFFIPILFKPVLLPKIESENGIPENAQAMVVIPTLIGSIESAQNLVETLQIRYLANADPHLSFALLSDYPDSDRETHPSDEDILNAAKAGIATLNEKYPTHGLPRFRIFHRKRLWNPCEGKWMGWERKRGKIHEFNRLLRGSDTTSFMSGQPSNLDEKEYFANIKYVITLDTDTQMPRDTARQLVCTILHPLNQPVFDPVKGRIIAGYGILQPRISIDLLSAHETRFAEISSGNTGLDPYTTAVSDVYQDLFAEGSFTGKGLYVVDAFEASLKDRVPENALLSHDLFEGSFARSGLVTDVEFIDDYPSDFSTFERRQHRWTRGDWQIAQWILPRVPTAKDKRARNDLGILSRWKILDNLRRSLVMPTIFAWLVIAWTSPYGHPIALTVPMIVILYFPLLLALYNGFTKWRTGVSWIGRLKDLRNEVWLNFQQSLVTITFLPKMAFSQCDAIIRTLYRLFVSRKNLLEWVSFADARKSQSRQSFVWDHPAFIPTLALLLCLFIFTTEPRAFWIATPVLLLWIFNPSIDRWLKTRRSRHAPQLEERQIVRFRNYARRTWRFFESFVGDDGNWLAPDNFQEDPVPVVAYRTSPTNIGLQLLATVSAYDFGYLGRVELITRLEKTFSTLGKLEKFHGHFYNWYDTRSLAPLHPQYVSTVDSGNLAGHLLTLAQALPEIYGEISNTEAKDRFPESVSEARALMSNKKRFAAGLCDAFRQVKIELRSFHKTVGDDSTLNLALSRVESLIACTLETRPLPEDFLSFLSQAQTELEWIEKNCVHIRPPVLPDVETPPALSFGNLNSWIALCRRQIASIRTDLSLSSEDYLDLQNRSARLMQECEAHAMGMDFKFLFDFKRKLFVIGYNCTDARRDESYYDLLASEARQASFIAIAKSDVPRDHWFHLGRKMTPVTHGRALISWSASMFEYLMPVLIMRRFEDTLLEQTYTSVVARQIEYGVQKKVPWGISEAGYNARDLQLNYQYGPFGIPGLGLKRGLSDELVVSPYSTMLAALINPVAALSNLRKLESQGVYAQYGFYESIDFTRARLPKDQEFFILRSFMAHHQGMSLVALGNLINLNCMQKRFHRDPRMRATQLLLHERIPSAAAIRRPRLEELQHESFFKFENRSNPRVYTDVNLPTPRVQLLSNGNYSVMITTAAAGYSRCGPLAISRWREDVTCDNWGHFFYIRNRLSGQTWTAGYQPFGKQADDYEVTFSDNKVDIMRRDGLIATRTEIIVAPEDDVELRRLSITNQNPEPIELEITSFMELSLAKPSDDLAHPAFSNLFVQTGFLESESALYATRRRRSHEEKEVWGFHVGIHNGHSLEPIQYETDRSRFLGRGRSAANPHSLDQKLSNTVGSVLDPSFSLRHTIEIPAGETVQLTFATGVCGSMEETIRVCDKYHDTHIFNREAELAWTKSQVQLRHLNIDTDKAHVYQRLASRIIYSDPSLRPHSHLIAQNKRAQTSLWAHGISGDLPIILTRIHNEKDMAMIRDLLHGHEYLRLKGLKIDLVIINERAASYLQTLQDELLRLIRMCGFQALLDKPGGVFARRADLMSPDDLILLQSVARISLNADKGTLDEQLKRRPLEIQYSDRLKTTEEITSYSLIPAPPKELSFYNGLGGFSPGGRQYLIELKNNEWTPAPWINVIANSKDFGFTISESGSGYTWSVNSRENRLTPWSNDPVSDPPGEVVYLRDEASGVFWTPTPLPIRSPDPYTIKHGQGYTQFNHQSQGIEQSLRMFVALEDEVKISRLRLKNLGETARELSITYYVEWVLGFHRSNSAPNIVTDVDPETGTLYAMNAYNNEFSTRVAFCDMSEVDRNFTCNRTEFIGRNGNLSNPAALLNSELMGSKGAGQDPCASLRSKFTLAPGEERDFILILGQAADRDSARKLALEYRDIGRARTHFQKLLSFWDSTLATVEIKTPDASMNSLVNRWLVYQTLSCRVWARSAFYQSGGAYGFRDQLQDVMALVYSRPDIAREHILRSAARQFIEGDVQHWWHPPTGRGVRTRFSDDLLWLPYVTAFYVRTTGDQSILQESVPFIEAPLLSEGHDDDYRQPEVSKLSASLFEHCARTIDRSLAVGTHGLPLMGSGDWNDGMSRVGNRGQGESVWVAWFLHSTITQWLELMTQSDPLIPLTQASINTQRTKEYSNHLDALKNAIETHAWDGDWYKRAYFDNGQALGSAQNEECRIDSIAQSWAVISGAGDIHRARLAMASVEKHLIFKDEGLIKLFTPPFDKSDMDPGYIKGYVPGVRENGGQYTHAAIWTLMAYALLGEGDRATELYSLINPINHALDRESLQKYRVEPYVAAADVYGLDPHIGRGGWTWYTGSASWLYRAALETLLGFELSGNSFTLKPRVPKVWPGFEITYQMENLRYHIEAIRIQSESNAFVELDGQRLSNLQVPLLKDGKTHKVKFYFN